MTDLRTLRLASLQLTVERLEAFVVYQSTLLAELTRSSPGEWSGRYAFAHAAALTTSKLDLVEMGKLKALVGDFCGRRSTVAQLKERIAAGGDDAKIARARQELPRLEDLSAFEERYGKEAVGLLMAREAELIQLHRELAKQEGGGGHLHPG
ncbi:MAG: hypothetical protein QM817_09465 [Archangium sp.]